MTYKLIIFDFDGTLADSFPFFLEAFDSVAERHGLRRLSPAQLEALRDQDTRQLMRALALPLWKLPAVALQFKALMAQHIGRIALFDGVPEALALLARQGALLAIVSSNSRANVCAVLGPHTAALFSHIECGVPLLGKRARLRRLLALTRTASHEALYIGDELRDVEAAHAERLDFGAVAWGYARVDALRARLPKLVFSSVPQLAAVLSGQAGEGASIRPAVAADAPMLSALARRAKASWGYSAAQLDEWDAALTLAPATLAASVAYVCERAAQVAGFYTLRPGPQAWQLEDLWVAPEHMRRGIGGALLRHARAQAAAAGAPAIAIDAEPHAESFYLARGAVRQALVAAPIRGQPERVRPQLLIAL